MLRFFKYSIPHTILLLLREPASIFHGKICTVEKGVKPRVTFVRMKGGVIPKCFVI